MFAALDVSTTALVAQRIRLDAISSNIANVSTTHNELGEPQAYQPRFVILQTDDSESGGLPGVKVASVEIADLEPQYKYQPGHPDAVTEGEWAGYVAYPNIDMATEMVNAIEASRAYEANVGVIGVTKNLASQSFKIVA